MELIYSMRRKPLKCEPPHFETSSDPEVVRPICTISACNIIAFSSPTELSDSDGCTWGGHVYVCDLDTPWDSHKVTSTVHAVSALEWDSEGKQLLVATTEGEVSVFGMKEFLLNEWTCLYSASFPGEHIIKAAFFHNGRRVSSDKKPDAPTAERLQLLRPAPTLKGFGGVACEGACIITATGLIGALTPAGESGKALSGAECLRPARDRIPAASVAHKNGNLVVAAGGHRCVRCAVCSVSLSRAPHRAPALLVQPLPTVYLEHVPVSLTWCLREDTDSLLIAGSTLSVWKLTERSHPVHKLLSKGPMQGNTTPGGGQKPGSDCFNTVVWQQVSVLSVEGSCAHVCSRRLHGAAPFHVLAVTGPNRLLVHRDTHRVSTTSVAVAAGGELAGATPPKKTKYGALPSGAACAILSCCDMSWLGSVCVCVDTHAQLHVYRLPAPDIPTPLLVQNTTSLLEYAMVSGIDYRDVIMTLKSNIIEAVYERFTESFQRQPPAFQQFYYQNWLKLRIALCRVIGPAQGAVSSLTQLVTLAGAWAALGAALRERERDRDAPLARLDDPRLEALLDPDHEKALLALEAKAELSSDAVALTPLRRVLQQCVDIAVTHLQHATTHGHPYETWTDGTALTLLRKLVVAARAAGAAAAPRAAEPLSRALARLQHQPGKEARGAEEVYTSKLFGYPYFDFIRNKNELEDTQDAIPIEIQQLSPISEVVVYTANDSSNQAQQSQDNNSSNQAQQSPDNNSSNQAQQSPDNDSSNQAQQLQENNSSNQAQQSQDNDSSNQAQQSQDNDSSNQAQQSQDNDSSNQAQQSQDNDSSNQAQQSQDNDSSNQAQQSQDNDSSNQAQQSQDNDSANQAQQLQDNDPSNQAQQSQDNDSSNQAQQSQDNDSANQAQQSQDNNSANQAQQSQSNIDEGGSTKPLQEPPLKKKRPNPKSQTQPQVDPVNTMFGEAFQFLQKSSNDANDPYFSFGNHIANELRKYDPRTLACVKNAINNIIFEADLGKYSQQKYNPGYYTRQYQPASTYSSAHFMTPSSMSQATPSPAAAVSSPAATDAQYFDWQAQDTPN